MKTSTQRVLLVRLRSVGDTVLMTPCLAALKAWQPQLEIDVLMESLAAPILQAHPDVTQLFVLPNIGSQSARLWARGQIIRQLRARHYDIAFNLHGGTTATFLTRLSGAKLTVGYQANQYSQLLSSRAPSPGKIWQKSEIHCVEQQLALLKWVGIPINQSPPLSLAIEPAAQEAITKELQQVGIKGDFALIHPAAAFASKQWETSRFARTIEYLYQHHQLPSIMLVTPVEATTAHTITAECRSPVTTFAHLSLAQSMALIARAHIFLGNDSGPAHIAAAFGKPLVVVFGSSNAQVWHPWTKTEYRLLRADLPCAPCAGYHCSEFSEPECIKRVAVDEVNDALDTLLATSSINAAL